MTRAGIPTLEFGEVTTTPFVSISKYHYDGDVTQSIKLNGISVGMSEVQGPRDSQEDATCCVAINSPPGVKLDGVDVEKVLKRAYKRSASKFENYRSGSCGISVYVKDGKISICSLGDCEAFLIEIEQGQNPTMIRLNSNLHNCFNPSEIQRIIGEGGILKTVDGVTRVNGVSLVTRSFGDAEWGLSSEAETFSHQAEFKPNKKMFLIVACDGMTEKMKGDYTRILQKVVELQNEDPAVITQAVVNESVESGSQDNISVFVAPMEEDLLLNVFDGHGGATVSNLLKDEFPKIFLEELCNELVAMNLLAPPPQELTLKEKFLAIKSKYKELCPTPQDWAITPPVNLGLIIPTAIEFKFDKKMLQMQGMGLSLFFMMDGDRESMCCKNYSSDSFRYVGEREISIFNTLYSQIERQQVALKQPTASPVSSSAIAASTAQLMSITPS